MKMLMVRRRFRQYKILVVVVLVLFILISFDLIMSLDMEMSRRKTVEYPNIQNPGHYKNENMELQISRVVKDLVMNQVPEDQGLHRKNQELKNLKGQRHQKNRSMKRKRKFIKGKTVEVDQDWKKKRRRKRNQLKLGLNKKSNVLERNKDQTEQTLNRNIAFMEGEKDQVDHNLNRRKAVLEIKKNEMDHRKKAILERKIDHSDHTVKTKHANGRGKTKKLKTKQMTFDHVTGQLKNSKHEVVAHKKKLKENPNVKKKVKKRTRKNAIHQDHIKPHEAMMLSDMMPEVKLKPLKLDVNYPGKDGAAVLIDRKHLTPAERAEYNNGLALHGFNQYASDLIPVDRSVPDHRVEECKRMKYPADLPNTSVIICFHNEAWSVLLRTVHSVINKSPPKLLKEIILVDDYSDLDYLGAALDRYMATLKVVKIIHAKERLGLIRGRLHGVAAATGTVLTFLDSHIECQNGWLEPLLARVALSWKNVAWPNIPSISQDTFEFMYISAKDEHIGGFYWTMNFHWITVSDHTRNTQKSIATPLRSPTMAGGLFSIHKKYFQYLGEYDQGMEIWGAENLELSFKIWMCGGVIEAVPCSIVGHVFRKRTNLPELKSGKFQKRNIARLVEVWLDEYKDFYYEMVNFEKVDYGNISDRQALRQRLGCHNFDWYMKNINPTMFVPNDDNVIIKGSIILKDSSHRCLGKVTNQGRFVKLKLSKCRNKGGLQMFYLSKKHDLRHQFTCLDVDVNSSMIGFNDCDMNNFHQEWYYRTDSSIYSLSQGKCLEAGKKWEVKLAKCTGRTNQKWKWVLGGKEMQPRA